MVCERRGPGSPRAFAKLAWYFSIPEEMQPAGSNPVAASEKTAALKT